MALSYIDYTGDGVQTDFAIPYSYLRREDIKVYVNGVDTAFTFVTGATVRVSPAPAAAATVRVQRETIEANPRVTFSDGSGITATSLNTAVRQSLYAAQEARDFGAEVNDQIAVATAAAVTATGAAADAQAAQTASEGAQTAAEAAQAAAEAAAVFTRGANTRTSQSKHEDQGVSVKDCGAVGNGVADDTAAFALAISLAPTNGGHLHIPAGTYRLTNTLTIPYNVYGLVPIGEAVLNFDLGAAVPGIIWGESTRDLARPVIGGRGRLTIKRNAVPAWGDNTSVGLRAFNPKYGRLQDVLFLNWDWDMEWQTNAAGMAGGSTGGSFGMGVLNCEFWGRLGVVTNSQSGGNSGINSVSFFGCRFVGLTVGTTTQPCHAVVTKRAASGDKNANQWTFVNCTIELGANRWQTSTAYTIGTRVTAEVTAAYPRKLRVYEATANGTSAASGSGPTGTGSGIADGTVTWNYVGETDRIPFLFEAGISEWQFIGGRSEGNGPIFLRGAETSSAGDVTRFVARDVFAYLDNELVADMPTKDGTYQAGTAFNGIILTARQALSGVPVRTLAGSRNIRASADLGSDGVAVDDLHWFVGEASAERLQRHMRRVISRRYSAAKLGSTGVTPNTTVLVALGRLLDVRNGGQVAVECRTSAASRRLVVAVFDANGHIIDDAHGDGPAGFRVDARGNGALTFMDAAGPSAYLGAYRQSADGTLPPVVEFVPEATSGIRYAFIGVASTAEIEGLELLVPVNQTSITPVRAFLGAGTSRVPAGGEPALAASQTLDEGHLLLADRPTASGSAGWSVLQGGTQNASGLASLGSPSPAAYRVQNRAAIVFDSTNGIGTLAEGQYISVNNDLGCRVEGIIAVGNLPAWATGRAVQENDFCTNAGELYVAEGAGTTGVTTPVHVGGSAVSDGGVTWRHVENIAAPSGGTGPLHSVVYLHKAITSTTGRGTISYTTSAIVGRLPVYLAGSAAYDPPSLTAGAYGAGHTVTVTGARVGDMAIASFSLTPTDVRFHAAVTADDTVTVIPHNHGGSVRDLAAGTLYVKVFKL